MDHAPSTPGKKRAARTIRGQRNASRVQLRREIRRFARGTKRGMLVLDAGAGHGPYRPFFKHARYEAADFAQLGTKYTPLDYVCDLTAIPVEDGRFDRVLTSQVFEHLPDPRAAAAELFRVLKPGGRLFCSAPAMFHEHQIPYDYFRYTRYGLADVFEKAGFEVVRLEPVEGYFGTVAYQFETMARFLPKGHREVRSIGAGWRGLYLWPVIALTRRTARRLHRFYAELEMEHKVVGRGPVKNYYVVARKPLPPA